MEEVMPNALAVGAVDKLISELDSDEGPIVVEDAMRQVANGGPPSLGRTTIKGPRGMSITAAVGAKPAEDAVAVDLVILTSEGRFDVRVAEKDLAELSRLGHDCPSAVWAQAVWADAQDAVVGAICERALKAIGSRAARSSGVFRP